MLNLKYWLLSTSLFLIAGWISFCIPPKSPPLVNYDNLVFFDTSPPNGPLNVTLNHTPLKLSYLAPRTKEEILTMVKSVAATSEGGGVKRMIRLVGSGHSWSAVAQSDDLLFSLCNYKGLVSVNKKVKQATFRGGTTLTEVNSILEQHGLAMSQLGSISDQTVAGAIATGTHGSGIKFGNLATLVVSLELVTGQGQVFTLSATDSDTDLFKAAQVSIGLLGVITEVTFQCEAAFNLEETRSVLPLRDCLNNMHQLVHSAQHVKMWVEVFSETCVLHQSNRTSAEARDNPSPFLGLVLNLVFELFISAIAWIPSIVPGAMRVLFYYGDPIPPYNRVDSSYKVFNIPAYFANHNEAEVIVDMKQCARAIKELKNFVEEERIPLNYITEIRFVQKDDIFLSPNYQRDSCHLSLCINHPSDQDRLRYFVGVFNMLTSKGLKPSVHWGKYFDLSAVKVSDLYPNLDHFLEIRKKLDPDEIFVNNLLSSTLGL